MFDRNMNGELEWSPSKNKPVAESKDLADRLVKVFINTNHMQMKQSNIKTMSFIKVPQEFKLTLYS
jgi:hypothetical protein